MAKRGQSGGSGGGDKDIVGPIAPSLGNPTRLRKVGGQIVEESIFGRRPSGEWSLDGVEGADFDRSLGQGRRTGWADFKRGQTRTAGTGAGPDVTYEPQRFNSYEIGSSGGGGSHLSQTDDLDGDVGTEDLFGEPSRQPRREFLDPGNDGDDMRYRAAPNFDGEDIVFENDESPTYDRPLNQRSPKRDSRRDEIVGRAGSTFAKRGF